MAYQRYLQHQRTRCADSCGSFRESITISKKYLVKFKDGSRKHVRREERDSMLLAGEIRKIGSNSYLSILPVRRFYNLADIGELKNYIGPEKRNLRNYLEGKFTIEFKGKRYSERLETPEAMALRMENQCPSTVQ
jgi:hypothetical protein